MQPCTLLPHPDHCCSCDFDSDQKCCMLQVKALQWLALRVLPGFLQAACAYLQAA